jgi:taurine--2-oxoglutarate transaminase
MLRIKQYLNEQGLFISQHWHTLLIIPPLIINEQQLAEGMAIIDQALEIADQSVVG